jgi:hypothetical protein
VSKEGYGIVVITMGKSFKVLLLFIGGISTRKSFCFSLEWPKIGYLIPGPLQKQGA